ncbi:MAG: glycosyl hydrolase family 18 protein [Kangiellaceae bacterium]|nr:glycosyl hydrolase family 18 protein [Kangiellaceae bacterium]MCW9018315.1 glycosyl hydrolase family 18 protein [Kangiellaceae bacterium]
MNLNLLKPKSHQNSQLTELKLSGFKKKFLSVIYFLTALLGLSIAANAATTADHNKQIVGYITQWDPWKDTKAGFTVKGAANHLNVDMSKYTILNFSFFGVAVDGSLHSGDFRNKDIYKEGTVQQPADLLNGDIYSSWDYYLIYGELEPSYNFTPEAEAQGFVQDGSGWRNTITGLTGAMPIPVKKTGGQPGLIELAHANGVKVMASIGGWSMCRHFPEMAADPTKRAKFMEGVRTLMDMGFDGIDLDWEYPGPYSGMNFTGSQADYANFLTLVKEIRAEIGPDKLITSAFSADTKKLDGFDWVELDKYMDYYNMMTYDFNGGWSNISGHNSPLYPYTGAEYPEFNWDNTAQWLLNRGVNARKINMGTAFYGRGVVTESAATLNGTTKKRNETIQPDGPIVTAADYTHWKKEVYDGTPNYFFIKQQQNGWTEHWDDEAKVPYLTKDTYFLSYDDERSIGLKAQYVNDYNLGGVIVWQVAGDHQCLGGHTMYGKLPKCNQLNPTLANKLNDTFANGCQGCPSIRISSPASGDTFAPGSNITINVAASDADGQVTKVDFYANNSLIGTSNSAPFSFTWNSVAAGDYQLNATATDNANNSKESPAVSISVNEDHLKPVVTITAPADEVVQDNLSPIQLSATATYDDGTITSVDFEVGGQVIAGSSSGGNSYSASWTPPQYGNFTLNVTATNNAGYSKTASKTFTVIQCTGTPWDAGTVYHGGDEVLYEGKIYRAKWWTQNERPDVSQVWEFVKDCGSNPDPAPTVSITSPADGSSFNVGTGVTLSADAADTNGSVTQVEFFVDNNLVATDTAAPFSTDLTNLTVGSHQLKATATDNTNNKASDVVSINIVDPNTNLPPTANFDSTISGLSVNFTDQSSDSDGQVVTWQWDFGDNNSSTLASPSHTYAADGTYSVTLTVTDDKGLASTPVVKQVTVTSDNNNNCTGIPDYPEGLGSYADGTQVQNNGTLYQCKPFPFSGWCNQGSAYEPGVGWAWSDAWTEVSSCQ